MYFFGLLQVWGWFGAGYFWHSHNWWAVGASFMFAAFVGLANAFYSIGKALNGDTSKSK
jgi:hypothetical protein